MKGAKRAYRLGRETGGLHQLLGRGHPAQLLGEQGGHPSQPAQIGSAVEREANRPAMPRDGRLNGLANPPDRIGDELHPPVRIELPGRGHQPHIPLADQVHERDAPVLELLGHRDHEPHVVPGKLFLGLDIALDRTPRQRRLLLHGEQGDAADVLQVEIEALAPLVGRLGHGGRLRPAPTLTLGTCHCRFSLGLGPAAGRKAILGSTINSSAAPPVPRLPVGLSDSV